MPKRRSMLIGMGALAMGSGAAFSSASFQNSLKAGADFRVVVDDNLVVESGGSFRDGDTHAPDEVSGIDFGSYDTGGDFLFSGNSLGGIGRDDLPAAAMNDGTNSGLVIEVATELADGDGNEDEFGKFLRVRNEGATDRNVAIGFADFGEDVSAGYSDELDGAVDVDDVINMYQFQDRVNENRISSEEITGEPSDSLDNQSIPNYLTVEAGATEDIDLIVDTSNDTNGIIEAARNGQPFEGESEGTVDLLDTIYVGTETGAPQNPDEV